MERSTFANVLIATRLLPHFNADSIAAIKSCIFKQFNCSNEAEFLCKVLKCMHKSLSNESSTIIKNKSIEIADSQEIENINEKSSNLTVYKYISHEYNDDLSQLNSDIIDYIGSFLSKKNLLNLDI